jgi:hypothetical protein
MANFALAPILFVFAGSFAGASSAAVPTPADAAKPDAKIEASPLSKSLCSAESQKRLAKLELRGESRFSEFKFDPDSTLSSNVEFTDLGESGRHSRRHKVVQKPAKPEYGQFLIMKALGKEKMGWRNLVVKCGVNKGKLATFTYEILSLADTGSLATPLATNKPAPPTETITTPHPALDTGTSTQPVSTANP